MAVRAGSNKDATNTERVKPVPRPASGTNTVCVACKIPNGLVLRIFKMVEENVPSPTGGVRKERIAREVGPRFTVRGPAMPWGVRANIPIIGGNAGYALTSGVPRALWETWLQQNRDADYVKNGLIFAEATLNRARD